MKFSDAVMLGSSMLRLEPMYWMCSDGGCLVGMAGYAAGVRFRGGPVCDEIKRIVAIWPWLEKKFPVPAFVGGLPLYSYPFPFADVRYVQADLAKVIISHLAVHVKLGNISLEQAVEWIRSVEPQEPETAQVQVQQQKEEVLSEAK